MWHRPTWSPSESRVPSLRAPSACLGLLPCSTLEIVLFPGDQPLLCWDSLLRSPVGATGLGHACWAVAGAEEERMAGKLWMPVLIT